jgi:hypothetical protein
LNLFEHKRGRRLCRQVIALAGALVVTFLAGCGPVKLTASTNIPDPLVVKIPVAVALFVPKEFAEYIYKEERWSTDWNVALGKAQSEGITRLMIAMFERVVPVESVNAGVALGTGIRAILEPSVEEFAFVTPRDAGSPFFAVSIKYRVNVYSPDGRLAESWGFTGYGTSPAAGLSSSDPLARATSLALRDAGAKLAVEFREQAIIRGLLPEAASIGVPAAPGSDSGVTIERPTEQQQVEKQTPAEPSAEPEVTSPQPPPPPPGNGLRAKDASGTS